MPEKGKPSGAWIPNPKCEKCVEDGLACLPCYISQGGWND
jgi:hypothetical protein